jgi:hypothetical protein
MRTAYVLGVFHNLLALTSNFFELRSDSPSTAESTILLPDTCRFNMTYCEIPVRWRSEGGSDATTTIVSPEDFDRLTSIAPEWRLSNRGYVVTSRRVEGKYRLLYMHREVAGQSAKHLNGDRLDNRRENLVPSKPRSPPIKLSPMDISTTHPILDYIEASEQMPAMVAEEPLGKYRIIEYPSGKLYSGESHNGLPHGLGTLIERNRSSFGWFLYGQFRSGCVLDHPDVCDRLRYLYKPDFVRPIKDGFVVLPGGKHVKLVGQ